MGLLKWKNVEGYTLTKEAIYNGFTYVCFFGTCMSERMIVDIYDGEKSYKDRKGFAETRQIKRFYGDKYCDKYVKEQAEKHAKKHSSIIFRIRNIFRKGTPKRQLEMEEKP